MSMDEEQEGLQTHLETKIYDQKKKITKQQQMAECSRQVDTCLSKAWSWWGHHSPFNKLEGKVKQTVGKVSL